MDTRKRALNSLPNTRMDFATKQEVTRNSYPPCPPLGKSNRVRTSQLFVAEKTSPRPVYFNNPVCLSGYSEEAPQSYFEQAFVISRVIGEGSFGVVHKTTSKQDSKVYAVKQMKASHSLHYGYAEVENCEKVGFHKNCVQFYMAWEQDRIIYLQMEYCEISLSQYAIKNTFTQPQLWEILHDMLNALHFLHNKKLIHLDIKPGNVMISQGVYKLGDFGLLVDLNKREDRKVSTISDGDAKYLACEVLDGTYTYSCDIFGLGISLLELATNIELPEFGPLWHQIRKEYLPENFYAGVSKEFADVIEKMMALAHWERPQAARLLKLPALKKVLQKDKKTAREVYYDPDDAVPIINNNILLSPKVQYDIAKRSGGKRTDTSSRNSSPTTKHHRGLSRTRLTF